MRGRPKKYHTPEEIKEANKLYVKKHMNSHKWHCKICEKDYHVASKAKHIKSKKHIKNNFFA